MTTTTTTRTHSLDLPSHQFVRSCQTNINGDDDEVMGVTVCPYYCGVFLLCTNSQSSSFPSSGQMMLSRIFIMVTMKTKTGVNIDEDLAWYSMMIRTVMTIIPVTRLSDVLNGGRLYLILLTSPLAHMFIAVVRNDDHHHNYVDGHDDHNGNYYYKSWK